MATLDFDPGDLQTLQFRAARLAAEVRELRNRTIHTRDLDLLAPPRDGARYEEAFLQLAQAADDLTSLIGTLRDNLASGSSASSVLDYPPALLERGEVRRTHFENDRAYLYLDTDSLSVAFSFVAAFRDLAKAVGLDMLNSGAPEIGSLKQRFRLRARGGVPHDEWDSRLEKLEHAAEVALVGKPMADMALANAQAIEALANAAGNVDNFIALTNGTFLVKATDSAGKTSVAAKTLSVSEARSFEKNPQLMANPTAALQYLVSGSVDSPPPMPQIDGPDPQSAITGGT